MIMKLSEFYYIKQINKSRAFSLVEVLVAVAVLALLINGLYTLFSKTVVTVDVGSWKAGTQSRMRITIKQLQKDIIGASYKTIIYPNKTDVDKASGQWKLKFKTGAIDPRNTQTDLMTFFICSPGRDFTPREANKIDPKIVKAQLKCDLGPDGKTPRLVYIKTVEMGASRTDVTNEDTKNIVLIENIIKFETKVIENPMSGDGYKTLKISIECAHPAYPKTILEEDIEIPLQVEAATL